MDLINPNFLKEARFYEKIDDKFSRCLTCERKCKIAKGKTGYCQTRINNGGIIYTIVYGLIPALSFNPIEKKPLFHFHPGTTAVTVGTYGCNFSCFWCQNHHLSHPGEVLIDLVRKSKDYLSPEKIIELAIKNDCQGTSISFNEPTLLFEYSLDVFKLAKKEGLYNTYVTNGYMTEEVLKELVKSGLDAMNIDIKGDSFMVKRYCDCDIENVWRNAKLAKNHGVHIEITTLLIEDFNTDEKIIKSISERIITDLGKETPFHISRFFPHYKSHEHGLVNPTPIKSLYKAYDIAKKVGLEFVYLGNLPNSKYENTYCPKCSSLVIERSGFEINRDFLNSHGNCKFCGRNISK